MFPTLRLLSKSVQCPEHESCPLSPCLFSHDSIAQPVHASASSASSSSLANMRSSSLSSNTAIATSLKRKASTSTSVTANEAPAKQSRTINAYKPATAKPSPLPVASTSSSATTSTTGPPRITSTAGAAHTPLATRQKMLTALYDQFTTLYAALPDQARALQLASRDAKQQEQNLYDRTTKVTYRNGVISALARLKKRSPAKTAEDTGTLEQVDERLKQEEERERNRLTRDKVKEFVHDKDTLKIFEYVVDVPAGRGGTQPTEEGNVRKCDRCGTEFVVKADLGEVELTACSFHWGRQVMEKINGTKHRVWSCCPSSDLPPPCQTGPHVFRDSDVDVLHSRLGFLPTSAFTSCSPSSQLALDLVALDCELVYTTSGMSLARVTVINSSFETILDEHVVPLGTVLDTNERFSGVTNKDLAKATLDGDDVRNKLGQLIDSDTVIVGHGLENDLKALRIVHDKVIDTAILYKHPNGGTWRFALRNLTKEYLGKFIQEGTAGHSAAEDSIAALELVRHKMVKSTR
ncbi:hypothetical protein ACM66B_005749 [Microbotryomycetes sp. NB124-2]